MRPVEVPDWNGFPWLEHGFGTRVSEGWTLQDGRTWVHQIHSALALLVEGPGLAGDGDAMITRTPGLLLEIRTADCLPVLLVDPTTRAVAAIHAGWRGVAGRIVPVAIAAMEKHFGCDPRNLHAAIGPGIGPCCFEVGPEVAVQFGHTGRVHIDLASEVRSQLHSANVPLSAIKVVPGCTRCDVSQFHSFRREGQAAGRMASAIRILAAD